MYEEYRYRPPHLIIALSTLKQLQKHVDILFDVCSAFIYLLVFICHSFRFVRFFAAGLLVIHAGEWYEPRLLRHTVHKTLRDAHCRALVNGNDCEYPELVSCCIQRFRSSNRRFLMLSSIQT